MIVLDIQYHFGHFIIKDIAVRHVISVIYLEQIISILSRAGFVRSIRGSQGGYYLAKEPSEFTVGRILRAAEGSLAPVDCLRSPDSQCSRKDECASLKLWKLLDQAISGVVDHYTLADLVQWQIEEKEA